MSPCARPTRELTGGTGRRVTVAANDRVEVRFPSSAAQAGTARFQIAGKSGNGPTRLNSLARMDSRDDRSLRHLRRD